MQRCPNIPFLEAKTRPFYAQNAFWGVILRSVYSVFHVGNALNVETSACSSGDALQAFSLAGKINVKKILIHCFYVSHAVFFYYAREKFFPLHGESFSSPPGKKVPNGDVRKNCIPRPMTILFGMKKNRIPMRKNGTFRQGKGIFCVLEAVFFSCSAPLFKSCGPQSWVSRPSRLDFSCVSVTFWRVRNTKIACKNTKNLLFLEAKRLFCKESPIPKFTATLDYQHITHFSLLFAFCMQKNVGW